MKLAFKVFILSSREGRIHQLSSSGGVSALIYREVPAVLLPAAFESSVQRSTLKKAINVLVLSRVSF